MFGLYYLKFSLLSLEWAQEVGNFRRTSGNAEAGGPRTKVQWSQDQGPMEHQG